MLVQNILNVKYFYHYYSRCAACVGIFNRRYRIVLHILSHFTCNRKNRKAFVFKRRSHRGASCMRQNLNSVPNHLWRVTEKIHRPLDKRHAPDFYFNKTSMSRHFDIRQRTFRWAREKKIKRDLS